ncbi:lysophospholipase [Mesobacillus maritimus]|uniref:alpha/beta hydrolase n=1 Tax=Mesobacillus maritimus TaxID=1643336 RepID=UPI00203ACB81|nr:alpha/beta hydrolase [Mesobacillus maritimus]MCM3670691.1 lysophospholipase [Mesobacillus maritimus]
MKAEGFFHGIDGAELYYRSFFPKGQPKGIVLVLHGFGDHSGGMQNICASLVKKHFLVYALDLRGHGRSSGKRGYIQSWKEFRGDLHEFRRFAVTEQPELPLFIVGHSMGGVIALEYVIDHQEGLDGVVAISPGISYELTRFERIGVYLLGKIKPDFPITKSGNFPLDSKDPTLREKYNPEGLRHNTATPGLGRGLMEAVSRIVEEAEEIKTPFLLQYGLDDKITPPAKLRRFYNQVSSEDKMLVEYNNTKHRPFDEVGKDKMLLDLTGWLDQKVLEKQRIFYKSAGRL